MTPSEHVEKIRAQWRAVGDGFRDGKEINLPGLLLTYAGDVGDLLTYLAASESARAAAEEQLAEARSISDRVYRAIGSMLPERLDAVNSRLHAQAYDAVRKLDDTLRAAAVAEEAAPRE